MITLVPWAVSLLAVWIVCRPFLRKAAGEASSDGPASTARRAGPTGPDSPDRPAGGA